MTTRERRRDDDLDGHHSGGNTGGGNLNRYRDNARRVCHAGRDKIDSLLGQSQAFLNDNRQQSAQ